MRARPGVVLVATVSLLVGACGAGGASTSPTAASGPRPASTGVLAIVAPRDGQTIPGPSADVRVRLEGARLVDVTTADIRPDEGHLHVTLDDQLVSMTGQLRQTLPDLEPGLHLLKVEYVAADHLPFDPRVIAAVAFTVEPS